MDLREHARRGNTKFLRSPRTRRRLGNSSPRTREKGVEKNNIPTVHVKYNYPYATGYSPYTRRRSPDKHTI
jgi:hypothetical protein